MADLDEARRAEVIIDVGDIVNPRQLHQVLKENLEFPDWYGMNWDAFWDAITGLVDMPERIVFLRWAALETRLPADAATLKRLLADLSRSHPTWGSEVHLS